MIKNINQTNTLNLIKFGGILVFLEFGFNSLFIITIILSLYVINNLVKNIFFKSYHYLIIMFLFFIPYCTQSLPVQNNIYDCEQSEPLINVERLKNELKGDMNFIMDLLKSYSIFTENYIKKLYRNYNNGKFEGTLHMIRRLKEDSLILYMGKMADISALLETYLMNGQNERFQYHLLKIYPQYIKIKNLITQIANDDERNKKRK